MSQANFTLSASQDGLHSQCLFGRIAAEVIRPIGWKSLCLLSLFFLGFGLSYGRGGGLPAGASGSQNPVPTLTGVTPNSATAGSAAFTLTASGTGFISTSVLKWNGAALATSYGSSTSLTAKIPASDVKSAGTVNVAVQNPAPGGGTSATRTFTIKNPKPTVSALSPSHTGAGSAAFTLTVTGTQFVSTSQVLWNGSKAPTTYESSTSLTAEIPASDVKSAGIANVAVQNPAPGGGTSGSRTFDITSTATNLNVLDLEGSDVIWNPSQQKLYVAVPSAASVNPGTITEVDPIAGSILHAQRLSSAPSGLAISDEYQCLYAVISGGAAIQRLTLPALTPDLQWSLGKDPIYGKTALAGDIKVQPGAPHTLAVSLGEYGSGSVAVFDDAVERSAVAGDIFNQLGNSLQWKSDGSELYAAYTTLNDSPYWTSVTDDALYAMPVTESGVGAVTEYNSAFREEGAHLHSDPTTGYVYGDWGEVINAAKGIPVGYYRWSWPNSTYFPGPLSVVDPTLKRFYTLLEVNAPDGLAFQIQAFDQTQFQLLSTIVIPNAAGEPTNFIPWGQAGLAFVTNGGSSKTSGKLYILDGSFVNPSGIHDTSVGTVLNPVPTLTAISPITAVVGSAAVTLTVTGSDFIGKPTVYWNGNPLATALVNSTELSAKVPASDLTSVTQATITASNASDAYPASNSMPFSVNPASPAGNQISVYSTGGNDLVWDATTARIYVSMPGIQGDAGDAIAIVNPEAGTVTSSGFLGSDPGRLSLSDSGQYLYMALNGENAIQQLALPDFEVKSAWNLGGALSLSGPYSALDLEAAPGDPETTAVVLANFEVSRSPVAVVVYDGSTPRPNPLQGSLSSLQWAGSDVKLYAVDQEEPQDFMVLGVGSAGAVLSKQYDRVFNSYSANIHYDAGTGLVYTDAGQAFQPSNGTIVGSYGASGIAVPDSTLKRVFILGQTTAQAGTSNYTIESFDQSKFTAIASIAIDNVVGTPTAFIRWGSDGLAFTTLIEGEDFRLTGPGQLYVISGKFVNPSGGASQSSGTVRLLPVQRTWGLGSISKPWSQSVVVHPNPLGN
jgi:hypothetical protein